MNKRKKLNELKNQIKKLDKKKNYKNKINQKKIRPEDSCDKIAKKKK